MRLVKVSIGTVFVVLIVSFSSSTSIEFTNGVSGWKNESSNNDNEKMKPSSRTAHRNGMVEKRRRKLIDKHKINDKAQRLGKLTFAIEEHINFHSFNLV